MNQIDAGRELRHGVLHLKPSVHFEEIKIAIAIHQELECTGVRISSRSCNLERGFYREAGRLDEALPLLEQTLAHNVRYFGARDPDTSTVRVYLAAAYQQSGRLHDAVPLFETALADTERALGAVHPNTLACRTNLAGAYQDVGDLRRSPRRHLFVREQ